MENHNHEQGHCGNCVNHAAVQEIKVDDLEELKNEITGKIVEKKTLPWNSVIVTAVLSALTLVSVAQAVQSYVIFSKVKSGDIKGSAAAPSSVQNLPNMVGGC